MPDTNQNKGFIGAFTWDNIGMQVANGIVSGGASFAINMLLTTLTEQKTNMNEMFQKFADQIVDRISNRMKDIIGEAFYQQNFSTLKVESASLESEYRAFLIAHSSNLLNHIEQLSFLIDEKAKMMEIPGLGIYCVEKTIQISIFKEKSKLNVHYKDLIIEKIKEAKVYLEGLRTKAIERIIASFSYKAFTHYEKGEIAASTTVIYFEGAAIDSVWTYRNGQDIENDFEPKYQFFKLQKISEFESKIYLPAKAIIDKL